MIFLLRYLYYIIKETSNQPAFFNKINDCLANSILGSALISERFCILLGKDDRNF